MQKANTPCCQGKNDWAEQPDVPSPPNSCKENSCDGLEYEAANSSKQPASTENNSQETVYPWMKEFRSKGTKQCYCRSFSRENEGEQRKWVGIGNNPSLCGRFRLHAPIFPESKKDSLDRIFRYCTN